MQTVRFQNREVFDDSDRQFQKARDVEQKESQAIQSYARATGFDIDEKGRQSQVQSANDQLALKQLAQFSDGINKMIQVAGPALAKKEAEKRAEEDLITMYTGGQGAATYVEDTKAQEQRIQKLDNTAGFISKT